MVMTVRMINADCMISSKGGGSGGEGCAVDVDGLLRDRLPGEVLLGAAASGPAHLRGTGGVRHDLREHRGQVLDEPVGVARGPGSVAHLVDRHQPSGDAV